MFEKELRKQPIFESPQNMNLDLANEIISRNKVSSNEKKKNLKGSNEKVIKK